MNELKKPVKNFSETFSAESLVLEMLGGDFYPDTKFSEAVRSRVIELTGKDPGFTKIGHVSTAPGFDPIKDREILIEQIAQGIADSEEVDIDD